MVNWSSGSATVFQVLVRLGILPAVTGVQWRQEATLTANDSGKFEDRWVHLRIDPRCPSPVVQGITIILPVRHGEGKFVPRDAAVLHTMQVHGQIAARYCGPDGMLLTRGTPMVRSMILPRCVIRVDGCLA